MNIKSITEAEKTTYNSLVSHPLQAYEWGEFRKQTGVKVIRRGFFEKGKLIDGFQLTIHSIPHTPFKVGYLPKGNAPSKDMVSELIKIGREEQCIFIQLEPNVISKDINGFVPKLIPAAHPLFTKYTFLLNLSYSEEELLKGLHPKTRYNIRVAQKHNVTVTQDNSDKAFNTYLTLTKETTKRQKFFAHSEMYHKRMWQTLKDQKSKTKSSDKLSAHLFLAKTNKQTLVAWILFVFKDTLYYPYGASSSHHREVMASNLMMWEAIKFGKKLGLKKFDMWGALGPNPNVKDPWYGFHRFKQGYGGNLTEFIGSYDLIINPILYQLYKLADTSRWFLLRVKNIF